MCALAPSTCTTAVQAAHGLYASKHGVRAPAATPAQVFHHTDHADLPALLAFWARVRVAVGPHGGALSNVMFMPPGGGLVELFPYDPVTRAAPPQLQSGGEQRLVLLHISPHAT